MEFFPQLPNWAQQLLYPNRSRCEVLRPSSAGGNLQMVSRLFLQFLHLTNTMPATLHTTSFLSSMFHLQHNLLTQYSVFEKMSLEMFFKILFQPFWVLQSCYLKLEQRINKIIIQWYHNSPMNKSCSVLLKQFLHAHCCLIITSAKPHPDPESSTPVTKATTASKYFLAVNKYF